MIYLTIYLYSPVLPRELKQDLLIVRRHYLVTKCDTGLKHHPQFSTAGSN